MLSRLARASSRRWLAPRQIRAFSAAEGEDVQARILELIKKGDATALEAEATRLGLTAKNDDTALENNPFYQEYLAAVAAEESDTNPGMPLPYTPATSAGQAAAALWTDASRSGESQLDKVEKDMFALIALWDDATPATIHLSDHQEASLDWTDEAIEKENNPFYQGYLSHLEKLKTGWRPKQAFAFRSFCEDPALSSGEKLVVYPKYISSLAEPTAETTAALVDLASQGRMKRVKEVCAEFINLNKKHRGVVDCVVVSAEPLDKKTAKSIQSTLQSFVGEKKTLIVDQQIDESLLGGFTVEVDNHFGDFSIRKHFQDFTQELDQDSTKYIPL